MVSATLSEDVMLTFVHISNSLKDVLEIGYFSFSFSVLKNKLLFYPRHLESTSKTKTLYFSLSLRLFTCKMAALFRARNKGNDIPLPSQVSSVLLFEQVV
jgi:hypothetical protein